MMEASLRNEVLTLQRELRGFHFRVIKLECGLRATQSEVQSLNTELAERRENEQKLNKFNDELKEKVTRLEDRMADIEARVGSEPQSFSQGNAVLEILNTLDSEIRIKFEEWNGKQVSLQKEVEDLKESVKKLLEQCPVVLPEKDPLNVLIDEDNDDIQILTPPTCMAPSPPHQPPSPVDIFEFNEEVHKPNKDCRSSPVPGPSTRMDDSSNTARRGKSLGANPHTGSSKKMSSSRVDPRWCLQHGVNSADDASRKTCLCGTKLTSTASLDVHIHHFTGDWKFSCKICLKPFARCNQLTWHMKQDHNITFDTRRYGCRSCGKVLTSRGEYRIHFMLCRNRTLYKDTVRMRRSQAITPGHKIVKKSTSTVQPAPQSSLAESLTRSPCSRKVAPITIKMENGKPVKTLNSTHGKDYARDFTCLCGRQWNNDRGLKRHVRYHTIRRFRCRYCGRWFAYACYRNAHVLRTHKNLASSNSQSQSIV